MLKPGHAAKQFAAALACAACLAASTASAEIVEAEYADPTSRYDHGILGDEIEWGALLLTLHDGSTIKVTLPETRVFEDLNPRLADVDGDGFPEVITVETSLSKGARLSIYDEKGLVTAAPYIGRPHRWLAPIGVADLDGDGNIEIAYIDRPHLAKTLMVWRFEENALRLIATKEGLTNHQIGWDVIPGGIRNCGAGWEMITASGDWRNLVSTTLKGDGVLTSKVQMPLTGNSLLNTGLNCP